MKRILNIAVPNRVENGLFQLSKAALSGIAFRYAFVTVIGQCMGAGMWRQQITTIRNCRGSPILVLRSGICRRCSRKWTKFRVID